MRREEVIRRLKEHESEIRAFGVEHLHLYGSHARDEAGPNSDVDLFFDRDMSKKIGLFELIGLKFRLEALLGIDVDVGTRTSLHPVLKDEIERSSLPVF